MSVKSKNIVTKLPGGTVYIVGPPKFVGRMPVKSPSAPLDPEIQEMVDELFAVVRAGDGRN